MDDFQALSEILEILKQLEPDVRRRVLHSVQSFLGLSVRDAKNNHDAETSGNLETPSAQNFSKDRTLSAKEFLRDKQPITDVERVACLAYYLTYYRETPHFKTLDISNLNTEAAQPKFANTAVAVDNARARGYLVPATKGNKQISAAGEKFVELLPDRDAARQAIRTFQPKRKKQRVSRNG